GAGTPSGTVTFRDTTTVLGTVPLTGSTAALAVAGLTKGTHTITATYNGDTFFNASPTTAGSTVNEVAAIIPAAQFTSAQSLPLVARVVTRTVVVPPRAEAGFATATGTVTFVDGATPLGTIAVNSAGIATLAWTPIVSGIHTLTASYSGDSNYTAN